MCDLSVHAVDMIFCKTCPRAIMHWKANYTHRMTQFAYKISIIAKNCMCVFCAVFRKLGPKDINPFFCHQITFYLKQEMEYIWVMLEKNIIVRKPGWSHWVRVQVCPHSQHISPSWRMKKRTSMSQAWLSTLPQPPALWGSVTFSIKEGVLVFNTLNYSVINGLLLQIKIQIWHKPIWFAHICPYQYSIWWADVLQWADSLLCLGISALREKGRRQQRCHCFVP